MLTWLKFHSKVLVNTQPTTEGLWTYQSSNGKTLSVLDYMICDERHLPYVTGLVIDDNREATTLNNDHNLMISIVKVDYQKVQWQTPKPRGKWDMENIKKGVFKETLKSNLVTVEEARIKNGKENSPVDIISDVTDCIISALTVSTSLITSTKKRPKLSTDIVQLKAKIQEAELTRTNILKANGGSSASLCTSKLEDLKTLTQLIKDLGQEKDEIFQSQSKQANKKTQKVTNSKGKRTSTFWSVIKPQE